VCAAAKNRKKNNKTLYNKTLYFRSSESFKVIDVNTTKKLVTSTCCDKQHAHVLMCICNRFHNGLANSDKITTFTRVPLFYALVSLNLKGQDLDR